ncbi:Thymidine kinase 2, mitochondrial [Orchesella cincta]|uniref:Thymidine kinase 2, mitochondrial n=1 Tax=Orchesella cincta TaxID=48709 RepID=A0A1D2NID5_ORCCI|nr:Thymidine kinase 2, mitochondrial [Orchesella cincta]
MLALKRFCCHSSSRAIFSDRSLVSVEGLSRSPWVVLKYSLSNINLSRRFVGTDRKMQQNQNSGKRVITVSVDGNISSGKSTLVSSLKELFPNDFRFEVDLVPEPLEKWTDLKGHNLLGMFYEDSVKNNFMFQHYVQLTRLIETIKRPSKVADLDGSHQGTVRIMERSLQNNRYCFTELARREGRLQPEEFAVLSEWHSWMEEHFNLNLDLLIYLRTSPETVFNRMNQRGREEESSVPFDYLKNLHETYEDWLVKGKVGNFGPALNCDGSDNNFRLDPNQKVIVIDANQGKAEVALQCKKYLIQFMSNNGYDYQNGTESNKPSSQKRKHSEIDNNVVLP